MKRDVKLLWIAIASVLLVTAMAVYFSYSWSRREAIDTLHKSADDRMSQFSLGVFAPTDKYAYLPSVASHYPVFAEALMHPGDASRVREASALLERLNAEAGSTIMYLLTLDGRAIATSNWKTPESLVGKNFAFRPYFIDALYCGEGRFYGVGVATAVPGYYISRLVKLGNTKLGVIVAKIDLRELALGWGKYQDEVVLTDKNDVVFLSSREEWKYRPMSALTEQAKEGLKRTRQYGAVLKEPLVITRQENLRADESIISMFQNRENGKGEEEVSYFVKSRAIPGSEWTIKVLTPMAEIDANARRAAILTVGAAGFIVLSFMYLYQVRTRHREREDARRALAEALHALEEKHRNLQAVSEELHRASITDPLTGAFNRRFFLESAAKMASSAKRHRFPLSVIVIDADHFKKINDVYGHPAGDKALETLAAIYREGMREGDIFARFGGEEFIIALPHTDIDTAQHVAERLREKVMSRPIEVDGGSFSVTISSGVSAFHLDEDDIRDAIKRADEALYEAKKAGRNRVVTRR